MHKIDKMVIELRGVDFVNKGAELMLHAIISKLKSEIGDPLFVMSDSNNTPRSKQLQHGIYTKTNFKVYNIPFRYLLYFVPFSLRRKLRYINEKEIDVILDASGFAFGDVWGAKYAINRLGKHIIGWKTNNKKVILLPQAFGPFTDPDLAAVMKKIISNADLTFVRDETSLQYVQQVNGVSAKVSLAPDFTNLIQGTVPSYFDASKHEVAIIVNNKMVETTTKEDGDAYFNLIFRITRLVEDFGFKAYFLIHEGKMDKKLAEELNKKLITPLPVIEEDNPLHVKGIISKSKAVITSRFHGLVSCLAQGIPCLATGWSHKYEMILKDYDYEEALLDVNCNDEELLNKVSLILTDTSRKSIACKLKSMSSQQKKLSEQMWSKVLHEMKNQI